METKASLCPSAAFPIPFPPEVPGVRARSQQCGEEAVLEVVPGPTPPWGTRVGLWCSPRVGLAPHLSPPVPRGTLEWGCDARSATIPMGSCVRLAWTEHRHGSSGPVHPTLTQPPVPPGHHRCRPQGQPPVPVDDCCTPGDGRR